MYLRQLISLSNNQTFRHYVKDIEITSEMVT